MDASGMTSPMYRSGAPGKLQAPCRIGHDKPHVQLQEPGQVKDHGRIRHDKAQGACKMAPGARLCKAMAIAEPMPMSSTEGLITNTSSTVSSED